MAAFFREVACSPSTGDNQLSSQQISLAGGRREGRVCDLSRDPSNQKAEALGAVPFPHLRHSSGRMEGNVEPWDFTGEERGRAEFSESGLSDHVRIPAPASEA